MELGKLNRSSLSQQIAEQIIEEILSGVFKPGTMLPSEKEFCEGYKVSRPVIREALSILSAQGYIEIIKGKGSYIQEVNDKPLRLFFQRVLKSEPESLLELHHVRQALEVKSAMLAALNRTDDDLVRLEKVTVELQEQSLLLKSDFDIQKYAALDVKFHLLLSDCSKNSFLYYLNNSISQSLSAMNKQLVIGFLRTKIPELVEIHSQVFEAIRDQNPLQAEIKMNEHYEVVIRQLEQHL